MVFQIIKTVGGKVPRIIVKRTHIGGLIEDLLHPGGGIPVGVYLCGKVVGCVHQVVIIPTEGHRGEAVENMLLCVNLLANGNVIAETANRKAVSLGVVVPSHVNIVGIQAAEIRVDWVICVDRVALVLGRRPKIGVRTRIPKRRRARRAACWNGRKASGVVGTLVVPDRTLVCMAVPPNTVRQCFGNIGSVGIA